MYFETNIHIIRNRQIPEHLNVNNHNKLRFENNTLPTLNIQHSHQSLFYTNRRHY